MAEILVLDQFSRNIHRNFSLVFAADVVAVVLAQEAITLGVDKKLSDVERSFLYMPFMHSESAVIHQLAVKLFADIEPKCSFEF